mgnify:FL=1
MKQSHPGGAGQIAASLLKFSLPLILSGILQQLYNWVDAFVVGNINGELALAAVGATSTVVNFYVTAITGFTLGLSILFAQKFGSGDTQPIPRLLSTFSVVLGAVFAILAAAGSLLTTPILRLMNTTPDTMALAESYLRIVLLGVPFLAVYNVYAAALRGIGDSRAPFLSVLVSSAVNIVLDILLVAVADWSVAGAAAATVASQIAMAGFLVLYGGRRYALLRFPRGGGVVDREAFSRGLRFGIPPMIQSSVSAFGSLILQNFMNGFGTQTVAAITTAYRIDSIVILPMVNLASGISTMVAQSFGAGDERRGRSIFKVGTGMMAVVSLALTALVIPAGAPLISLFGVEPAAVDIGRIFFRQLAVFYVVYGLSNAVRGYLEGMGDVLYSSVAGVLSLLSRIIASYAMVGALGRGTIAYAEAFSWGVLLMLYLIRAAWRGRRTE